jgi:hypothetical protein
VKLESDEPCLEVFMKIDVCHAQERLKAAVARNNTMKADLLETFRRDKIVRDRNWERVLEASWRQCEVWKSVSAFLIRGFRDQQADFNKRKQEVACTLMRVHVL